MNRDICFCICEAASYEALVKLFYVNRVFRSMVISKLKNIVAGNWLQIIHKIKLGPKFIEEFIEHFDYHLIAELVCIQVVPEYLIVKYDKIFINMNYYGLILKILQNQLCSEKFIETIMTKIPEDWITSREHILREAIHNDNKVSETLIDKYIEDIKIIDIIKHQRVSESFIAKHIMKFLPYRKKLIKMKLVSKAFVNQHFI
jgi:hypothetical protein